MKDHPKEQSQHTSQIWDNYYCYAVQSDIFASKNQTLTRAENN